MPRTKPQLSDNLNGPHVYASLTRSWAGDTLPDLAIAASGPVSAKIAGV